eukprot:CAMPEP_0183563386 /NCGR_PEP_ID=MMETSP0371-20130417/101604_1 /TAXON_ID=268820 /ORGANISM="Peridinium aciculiferum, Strain PAER-2" /LENGTH=30 /DNA_ID= /DNA_START= /DNA_END= /DNA_ORIENTATION=
MPIEYTNPKSSEVQSGNDLLTNAGDHVLYA